MKERPLPFSAPMVRALISGAKTQTRRLVKPQPRDEDERRCPYGVPGDRLWVKETWGTYRSVDNLTPTEIGEIDRSEVRLWYRADGCIGQSRGELGRWRPSIHMPRWASRITLEISEVRLERLQEISEEDAKAEGAPMYVAGHGPITPDDLRAEPGYWSPRLYRAGYEDLWESINGPGSWEENPWVWVISVRRVAP